MTKPKIAVILAGCGVYDGAEIHESVLTLLALDRAGAEIVCLAPDVPQRHVVNHLTGQPAQGETRNVLVEAARIARGAVSDVAKADPAAFDAVVIPGGFGAAKNLSSFAVDGEGCTVDPGVARLVSAVHAAGKPGGAMCIAPVILAKLRGKEQPSLTIGTDAGGVPRELRGRLDRGRREREAGDDAGLHAGRTDLGGGRGNREAGRGGPPDGEGRGLSRGTPPASSSLHPGLRSSGPPLCGGKPAL